MANDERAILLYLILDILRIFACTMADDERQILLRLILIISLVSSRVTRIPLIRYLFL